jgi:hypothetical protein
MPQQVVGGVRKLRSRPGYSFGDADVGDVAEKVRVTIIISFSQLK